MAGLVDDNGMIDWSGTELEPFNVWSVVPMKIINEDGVSDEVVLYLYSQQTEKTVGILLNPQTAAQIGLDLIDGFVNEV